MVSHRGNHRLNKNRDLNAPQHKPTTIEKHAIKKNLKS